MVVRCFACKSYMKGSPALGYFRFPKDDRLCTLWFERLNQPRLPEHTAEFCHMNLRVCSKHFRPQDVVINKIRKRLYPDAVPIINTENFDGAKVGELGPVNSFSSDQGKSPQSAVVLKEIHYDRFVTVNTMLSSLENIEPLMAIKNEPPESEIGIDDDIPNLLDEEIIPDIKDIDIVSHVLSEDLIKSETVSENTFENNHSGSVETQVFVKTENIPLIKTENGTQSEYLYKTQDISDGNVSRGTSQGVIEVQGLNEHFNSLQSDKQFVNFFKDLSDISRSRHEKNKRRSETYSNYKLHELSHTTKTKMDGERLKYRCDACKFETYWPHSFKNHKLIHLKPEEIPYLYCYHCTYKSKHKQKLKEHIFRHFKKEEIKFHCYICNFMTRNRELIIGHIKTHSKLQLQTHTEKHEKRYHCTKCMFVTRQSAKFKLHELSHKTKEHRCAKCDYKTCRLDHFKRHKLTHLKPEEIQYFYCYHCSFKSKRKDLLKSHIFRHFKNGEIKFHCYICNFMTVNRDMMIKHIKNKEHDKRYCCTKCMFVTRQSAEFKLHELSHKTKEQIDNHYLKYRCEMCDYKTYRYHGLKWHKLIHLKPEESRYFYCYHCSHKSNLKNNLKYHISKHFRNGDVPFHCYVCYFMTLKRELIVEHIKNHSKVQLETRTKNHQKRYCCAKCAFVTRQYAEFKLHELSHKRDAEIHDPRLKHSCDKCNYKTDRHDNFTRHKLNHLKLEEIQCFCCFHCSYKSKRKDNLEMHVVRHFVKEEITFHCYVCDFMTPKRELIIEHIKKHSKVQIKTEISEGTL